MAEAFLTAGLVAAIAAVAAYMSWDLSVSVTREIRRGRVAAARKTRAAEDAAWKRRTDAYAAAQAITLRRAQLTTAEALADALTPTPAEVVA